MKNYFFFCLLLIGCTGVNRENLLERKGKELDGIIAKDFSAFDGSEKDTLFVRLMDDRFCGNDPTIYIDCHPLFKKIQVQALKSGFKVVLEDTIPSFAPKQRQKNLHAMCYWLHITFQPDSKTVSVSESFFDYKWTNPNWSYKDTTINL